jgi:hypothetical protein
LEKGGCGLTINISIFDFTFATNLEWVWCQQWNLWLRGCRQFWAGDRLHHLQQHPCLYHLLQPHEESPTSTSQERLARDTSDKQSAWRCKPCLAPVSESL